MCAQAPYNDLRASGQKGKVDSWQQAEVTLTFGQLVDKLYMTPAGERVCLSHILPENLEMITMV